MADPFSLMVVGVGAAAFVGLGVLAARRERRRTAAFKAFAAQRRFQFEGDTSEWERYASGLRIFQQGRSKRLFNAIHGNQDTSQVLISDYEYVTGSGKSRTTHQFTVCVVRTQGFRIPFFYLRPQRSMYDALGKLFGGRDIDFEDDPAFSKAFVLQGDDQEDQVRRLFTPGVREHMRAWADQDVWLEGGDQVVLLHHRKRIKPEELERLFIDAITLRRLFAYDLQKRPPV